MYKRICLFVTEREKQRAWQTFSCIPQMTHTKALKPPTHVNIMCMLQFSGLPYDLSVCVCMFPCVLFHVAAETEPLFYPCV